ncbi:MAG TPA: DUF4837 family protein [Longimicrobiales bacterium]|nr:DUF4837 family protein [Longimicrobiales bacterium]
MVPRRIVVPMVLLAGLGAGCEMKGVAYGDANSIIAVMSQELWQEASEDVYATLEPTVFTVRDEKAFTVTYQEPYGQYWPDLRRFRQLLVVGTEADAWMQEILERADTTLAEPGIHQVHDIWSIGQTVTLVLLDETGGADALRQYLPQLAELYEEQYRQFARNRMFTSGVDTALADTLALEAGFTLYVPTVYRWSRTDSTYVFRNDNPDPSELIREVVVTWTTPSLTRLDPETLLDWRARTVEASYSYPQDVILDPLLVDTVQVGELEALQVQAQWRNPPDTGWPAAGPFILRGITCPAQDRTYLVDAWLYAPGAEKYEYMIQLETILDTFRCGP